MKPIIIFIIACCWNVRLAAQPGGEQDSLSRSISMMERRLFFDPDQHGLAAALADALCTAGRTEEGIAIFSSVHRQSQDSTGLGAGIHACRWLLKTGESAECIRLCRETLSRPELAQYWIRRYRFYLVLGLFEQNLLYAAVQESYPLMDSAGIIQVENAYRKFRQDSVSPVRAMRMAILPGLGHLYAGDRSGALNAFLLNGSIVGLSIAQGKKLPMLGLVLFAQFFPRYYAGNIFNARKSAVYKNTAMRNELRHLTIRMIAGNAQANDSP